MNPTFPTPELAAEAVLSRLGWRPSEVRRFATGSAHYVYELTAVGHEPVVARFGMPERRQAMTDGTALARRLAALGVPLPQILTADVMQGLPFVLMQRLSGTDLGHVISTLTDDQLRAIAARVAAAQAVTAQYGSAGRYGFSHAPAEAPFASWPEVLRAHLERSRGRMAKAGLFDLTVLDPVEDMLLKQTAELMRQPAVPFLHDTTTKNVLIDTKGGFSGIVDVDDLCFGDPRFAPALTLAVLLGYGGPVQYVEYWMAAAGHTRDAHFRLYVMLFLVDLMAEHGHVFNGNQAPSTASSRQGLVTALAEILG